MIHFRAVFVLFFASSIALCQNVLNQTGYNHVGTEFWASGGAGIAERGISATEFVNPSLLFFDRPTVTLETGWRPKTNYNGIDYDATLSLPSYASVGVPFTRGAVEAGYLNSYDERYDFGRIPITTSSQPDGTGQFVHPINTSIVHTVFAAASYTPPHWLTIGVAAGMDFVRYDYASVSTVKATGTRMHLALGTLFSPMDRLNIGLSGHWFEDVGLEYSITPASAPVTGNVASGNANVIPWYGAETPTNYSIGASFLATQSISVLASVHYEGWDRMTGFLQDVWQYRFGVFASVSPTWTVRAGFFSLRSPSNSLKDLLDEYFLTAGGSWSPTEDLKVSLAFMSSELFTRRVNPSWYISTKETLAQRTLSVSMSYAW